MLCLKYEAGISTQNDSLASFFFFLNISLFLQTKSPGFSSLCFRLHPPQLTRVSKTKPSFSRTLPSPLVSTRKNFPQWTQSPCWDGSSIYPKQKNRLSMRKTLAHTADLASVGTVGTSGDLIPESASFAGLHCFGFLSFFNQDIVLGFLTEKKGSQKRDTKTLIHNRQGAGA